VQPTGTADDLQGCDLIIASVFEKRDVKAQATKEAEARLAPGGFIGSNTSTLPITGLAAAVSRPQDFIGIHFFSPVDRMPRVEIIKGCETSPQTLARAVDFVQKLRKTPIVVNDSRGFFTSRVFGTFTKEGAAMLTEGIEAARIENAALAVGMPVGPLAVMDETSMALTWSARQQTIADLSTAARGGEPLGEHAGRDRMAGRLRRLGRAAALRARDAERPLQRLDAERGEGHGHRARPRPRDRHAAAAGRRVGRRASLQPSATGAARAATAPCTQPR
jgi:3-hydroxyacyl-CoA dehydrogenase/enoyl-CoA hydratase/3-hydroxybutyryl-CoA epimerase